MTTTRLTSPTGISIAVLFFCIGTLVTFLGLFLLGFSLRPAYPVGVVVVAVVALAAIHRTSEGH